MGEDLTGGEIREVILHLRPNGLSPLTLKWRYKPRTGGLHREYEKPKQFGHEITPKLCLGLFGLDLRLMCPKVSPRPGEDL